jgi:hypothetical protein
MQNVTLLFIHALLDAKRQLSLHSHDLHAQSGLRLFQAGRNTMTHLDLLGPGFGKVSQ